MKTILIDGLTNIQKAADIIQQGGLVASPTETVYGLCANALNPTAVSNIFKAKGRPNDNPLIIHIADLDMLNDLVLEISDTAKTLIEHFWPGPLTLIFKANPSIPAEVTAGLSTVAIRFPSHPMMRELITKSKVPIAAPSANTSGKPSPTNARRVMDDLDGKIEAVIDGSTSEFGLESTIVDTTTEIPIILRPGAVTFEMLEDLLGEVHLDSTLSHSLKEGEKPKAPGMKYTHYSPNAEVIIVDGNLDNIVSSISFFVEEKHKLGKKVGILATDETMHLFKADFVLSCGTEKDLLTVAFHLFEVLRKFDDAGMDIVYSLAFPKIGIGSAVMNRLEKSASHRIINV